MSNALSKKFNVFTLLKFTLPTIVMMVFMSLYTMVDGVYVSNYVGNDALSAVNIVYPAFSIVVAISIMLASGGSAVIAKNMGMGENRRAKENFSLIVAVGIGVGIVLVMIGQVFMEPILNMLGTTDNLHGYCRDYFQTLSYFAPFSVLQLLFQFFFVTAGRPQLGLWSTVVGGIANMVLDYIFIVPMGMGIQGAALATGIGYCIPAIFGLVWFAVHRTGTLYFVKPKWDKKVLVNSCLNGSSEMVTNLATAITTFLFNAEMLKYIGDDGVAAITIVLYSQFLLTAVFLGFSSGVAPVFGYNYGEKNVKQLKKVFKICAGFILVTSVGALVISLALTSNIVAIFVNRQSEVFEIAKHGFILFSINYLFAGCNIFASSMFTAFSNGKVSAIISFLRTFVFIVLSIVFLPMIMGVDGIWLAVPVAEFITLGISLTYIVRKKEEYHYM